ncbi:DnaJ domain-containing protein [Nocardioides sp. QY071]|uniref:J domain-containing protein n=1 Tax=Nocardioides sp. QY071 TaxID=3044187 RepID=UPI00249B7AF8|nr:DnaJ domain-containing protein [Nocardioides sp. QY071]WGY02759.1 DnaJ domain-containing protein [Nocardioides sp. QY071]
MSTNLYDLLDVEEDATEDQIRAAWKTAIADLDPTERRFRAFNDAAGVLLDADKRAAYDADLAAERAAAETVAAETVAAETVAAEEVADKPGRENSRLDEDASSSNHEFHRPAGETPARAATATRGDGPGGVALVAAAVAAVLSVALAVVLVLTPGARGEHSAKQLAQGNVRVERAAVDAEAAAEQMVAPVLSYSHKSMAADLDRRAQYMTKAFQAKTERSWPEITKEAETQKVEVEAKSAGAALTRVSSNGKRATVVVFIDQYVTKAGQEPFVLRMWATFLLVRAAGSDSKWLLDDLCTDDRCDK